LGFPVPSVSVVAFQKRRSSYDTHPSDCQLRLYIILELGLEVWFQIEVICNVAEFDSGLGLDVTNLGRGLALSMLLAHYMYLSSGTLVLLDDFILSRFAKEEEAAYEEEMTESPAPLSRENTSLSLKSSVNRTTLSAEASRRPSVSLQHMLHFGEGDHHRHDRKPTLFISHPRDSASCSPHFRNRKSATATIAQAKWRKAGHAASFHASLAKADLEGGNGTQTRAEETGGSNPMSI